VNRPVFDRRDRLLGNPDLLDPEAGVVGDDGADHHCAWQRSDDVDRESGFRDHPARGGPVHRAGHEPAATGHRPDPCRLCPGPAGPPGAPYLDAEAARALAPAETLAGPGLDTVS
jgi:hypothetical protein